MSLLPFLRALRHHLHQHPERSGQEAQTAHRIMDALQSYPPSQWLQNLGGHGLAAIYDFGAGGSTVLIRCELDALPISEQSTHPYRSQATGLSHACGHDGHMAMVAGLAPWLVEQSFRAGRVVLLFQPAEETGRGAYQVLQDPCWEAWPPDYVFALHNLPGEPIGEVVICPRGFSAAVISGCLNLKGQVAHASAPEQGRNPSLALAELVQALAACQQPDPHREDFALLTPICLRMGEHAYGISAGRAELHYTLRTWSGERLLALQQQVTTLTQTIGQRHGLTSDGRWFEHFPATENDPEAVALLREVAQQRGLSVQTRATPLRFGEDFGWFTQRYRGAMFGLGAGVDTPALHQANYDFPDALLETGVHLWQGIVQSVLGRAG